MAKPQKNYTKKRKKTMQKYKENENKLSLIPKTEKYIEYILNIIFKLPRTENSVQEQNIKQVCIKC